MIQMDVFPDHLRLLRAEPDRHTHRFYEISVQRDLFGRARLIREWGLRGRPGTKRETLYDDEGKAVDALARLVEGKRRRGYFLA